MIETRTRVAIVDDDASVRRGLKRLLQANECTVLTYGSAEEFLGLTPEEAAYVELRLRLSDALRELSKGSVNAKRLDPEVETTVQRQSALARSIKENPKPRKHRH